MMYGLVLVGGSGSRLWPLSRELYPKQLLKIQNTESLLQETFSRLQKCIPSNQIISMILPLSPKSLQNCRSSSRS